MSNSTRTIDGVTACTCLGPATANVTDCGSGGGGGGGGGSGVQRQRPDGSSRS